MKPRHSGSAGFTLVEIMIVVVILGLLAAVAIPQFLSSKDEGAQASMASNLTILRKSIDNYWSQHDEFPGQKDAKQFADHLLKTTNKAGKVGTGSGYGYGPYLRNDQLPINNLNDKNTVKVVDTMPSKPSGSEAWIYSRKTGEIRCNVSGKSLDGTNFFDF